MKQYILAVTFFSASFAMQSNVLMNSNIQSGGCTKYHKKMPDLIAFTKKISPLSKYKNSAFIEAALRQSRNYEAAKNKEAVQRYLEKFLYDKNECKKNEEQWEGLKKSSLGLGEALKYDYSDLRKIFLKQYKKLVSHNDGAFDVSVEINRLSCMAGLFSTIKYISFLVAEVNRMEKDWQDIDKLFDSAEYTENFIKKYTFDDIEELLNNRNIIFSYYKNLIEKVMQSINDNSFLKVVETACNHIIHHKKNDKIEEQKSFLNDNTYIKDDFFVDIDKRFEFWNSYRAEIKQIWNHDLLSSLYEKSGVLYSDPKFLHLVIKIFYDVVNLFLEEKKIIDTYIEEKDIIKFITQEDSKKLFEHYMSSIEKEYMPSGSYFFLYLAQVFDFLASHDMNLEGQKISDNIKKFILYSFVPLMMPYMTDLMFSEQEDRIENTINQFLPKDVLMNLIQGVTEMDILKNHDKQKEFMIKHSDTIQAFKNVISSVGENVIEEGLLFKGDEKDLIHRMENLGNFMTILPSHINQEEILKGLDQKALYLFFANDPKALSFSGLQDKIMEDETFYKAMISEENISDKNIENTLSTL